MSRKPRQVDLRGALKVSRRAVRAPLTTQEIQFVEEYLVDLDPAAAALRAGLDASDGRSLLSKVKIQTAVQVAKAQRSRRTQIYSDEVLRNWELARRVDYNEFVSVIVPPCRYCWGVNHHYQFTTLVEMEWKATVHAREQQRYPEKSRRDFDTEGGEGYNVLKAPCRGPEWRELGYEPNSDHSCPECRGVGVEPRLLIRDTRTLSHGALYLYEGASTDKNGALKLNLRSRKDFDEMIGRHLGLLGSSGQGIPPVDPGRMSDEQLDQVLESYGVKVDFDEATDLEATDFEPDSVDQT